MAKKKKKSEVEIIEAILALMEGQDLDVNGELRVLSSVTSYVLCNHIGNQNLANDAFASFGNVIKYTMTMAHNDGHTSWWGGTPH